VLADRVENLLNNIGLPTDIKNCNISEVMCKLSHDKKFKGKNRFVLLKRIGSTCVVNNVNMGLVRRVIEKRMK